MKIRKAYRDAKKTIKNIFQKRIYNSPDYFRDPHKVYLASADQFAGMKSVCESESIPQCKHFYSVIGGLGGLSILAKMQSLETINFFDVNPFSIEVCRLIFEIIKNSDTRDDFISLIYAREFDSSKYSIENQSIFYSLPLENGLMKRLEDLLGAELYEIYEAVYKPYIINPLHDLYSGFSIHCTRLPIFHEAQPESVMVYPFNSRRSLQKNRLSCVNSFFFGKGWLKSEKEFLSVKNFLTNSEVKIFEKSIFDLDPPANSGIYASNVFDGTEAEFSATINRFEWVLWYSRPTKYLKLEYIYPPDRLIPIQKIYGKQIKNTHKTCCLLLDEIFLLKRKKFLEVIQPHSTEGMNYGFRFYQGQHPISVKKFIDPNFSKDKFSFAEAIGVHILLGGGCPIEQWRSVVKKAVSADKPLFIFEHRKDCTDWPEDDVEQRNILPEKEIDAFLLSLSEGWQKYGTANKEGDVTDVRNLCWVLNI